MHETPQAHTLTALDAIFTRRSVRTYREQPLEESTIRSLLDAAVQAPTAMHSEPWRFVIVQDPEILKRLSDRAKREWNEDVSRGRGSQAIAKETARLATQMADPDYSIFHNAGTLVVICAQPGPFSVADCWLAAENVMLAACALGLGTCCVGLAIPMLNDAVTKAELDIPSDIDAVAAIVVGVPAGATSDGGRKAPHILSWTLRAASSPATRGEQARRSH